jgi:hypothetical protein
MTTSRLDFTRPLTPGGALEFVSHPRQNLTGELSATANRPTAELSALVIYTAGLSVCSASSASLSGTVIVSCDLLAAPDAAMFVGEPALDVNVYRGPSAVADDAWQQRAIAATAATMSAWERTDIQRAEQSSGWQQGDASHQEVTSALQGLDRETIAAGDLYQQAEKAETGCASSFSMLVRARDESSIVYEQAAPAVSAHPSSYRYPPHLRRQVAADSQPAQPMGYELQHSMWGIGASTKVDACSLYELGRQPFPGRTDLPVPPIIPEIVISARLAFGRPYGVGGHLEFYWSPSATHVIPTKRVYLVTNKVQFVRARDGMPIPSTSVSIEGDADSWAWQFTASLPRIRDAESLEGEEVIISINGHEWRCIVDGWSDNRSWGQQSATVTGRSLSAELSSGLHLQRSYAESNTRSIIQLAEQELPDGWVLDWMAADWLVPGGVWTYSNLSPVDAIQKIADAAGAFIAPGTNDRRLTVLSKYAVKPWELTPSAVDIFIPDSIMLTLGRQRVRGQSANGVWISGGNGFAGHVKRVGTAGGNTLADVSHELITDAIGARALGAALLANSLSRSTDSIELPINADTGLIRPGRIIETVRGIGYGRGLRASATVDKDRRLTVRQVIEVERPLLEDM